MCSGIRVLTRLPSPPSRIVEISSFIFCLLKKKSYALISSKETLNHTRDELKKYSPFYEVEIKFDSSFNFYGIEKVNFSNVFQEEISNKTKKELINVFVPTTPNPTSGFLLMFPKEEVIFLDLCFEEASKFIVSAGTSNPN